MSDTPLELPLFFDYFKAPGKLVGTPDGGMAAWRVDQRTGGWEPSNEVIDEVLFSRHGEISTLTRDAFVQRTEMVRGFYLTGDGPAFALYALVNDLIETAETEGRRLTTEERAVIHGLRRQSFVLFETDLRAKGDPAADPTLAEV